MVQELVGRRIRLRIGAFPPRSTDSSHWLADNRKAKELLGWEPQHSLREGLEKTIAWMDAHRDVYTVAGPHH
jgi:nucleoside-diphosphate-sugar epimerase